MRRIRVISHWIGQLAEGATGHGETLAIRRATDNVCMELQGDWIVENPRRRNMQANRRRDTNPERVLRSALHAVGLRYRCDYRLDLPDGRRVRPDIVFTRRRVAVFVDGCFWHSCPKHGRDPATNSEYWSPKLARNRERDQNNNDALESAGWTVIRVWEHEDVGDAVERVMEAVRRRG